MSKSVRKVIGVVAAIAVPFAAPAIAGAIGMSGAISGALGVSATVGSTIGGALTGAVLGGAASKLQGGKFGQGALMGGLGGGIGGYLKPTALPPGASAGAGLSAEQAAVMNIPSSAATAAPGVGLAPGQAAALNLPATGAVSTGGATPGLLSKAASIGGKLTPALVQGGVQLAAGALAGPSGAEKAMLREQTESLRAATEANRANYNERLAEARKLIGESAYFDPQYVGLQSARRAQIAGSRAKAQGLRGQTGEARQAEARRYDLGIARDTGTAYDVGFGTGVASRLDTRKAGLAAMPGAYPADMGSYNQLANAYGMADERAAEEAANIGKFAGDIYGVYTSKNRG